MLPDAAKGCVGTLAMWVRSAPGPSPGAGVAKAVVADQRAVSVIVCSLDDAKAAQVAALYARLLAGVRHEIISIRDAVSLAGAYNRGLDFATGDVIVLSHDDIEILATDFSTRLLAHLRSYDVVGVVGSVRMTGPTPLWAGHPYLRGWITHHAPDTAEWRVDLLDPQSVAGDVTVLDGVFLAARRSPGSGWPRQAICGLFMRRAESTTSVGSTTPSVSVRSTTRDGRIPHRRHTTRRS